MPYVRPYSISIFSRNLMYVGNPSAHIDSVCAKFPRVASFFLLSSHCQVASMWIVYWLSTIVSTQMRGVGGQCPFQHRKSIWPNSIIECRTCTVPLVPAGKSTSTPRHRAHGCLPLRQSSADSVPVAVAGGSLLHRSPRFPPPRARTNTSSCLKPRMPPAPAPPS